MMPTLDDTVAYIKSAHAGQLTKGGEPYWTHPVAVMELLPAHATDDERHAALLHDVIEDCGVTADDLRRLGYSDRTVHLVEMLSRPLGPTYMEWIEIIARSGDAGLIRIKLADTMHNSDPRRIAMLQIWERGIAKRYEKSIEILRAADEVTRETQTKTEDE